MRGYLEATKNARFVRRFWQKVSKTPGCWIWRGSLTWNKLADRRAPVIHYGTVPVIPLLAARVSWLLTMGPDFLGGHHLMRVGCNEKTCVNPAHHAIFGTPRHFWTLVDKSAGPNECWPFIGGTDAFGYGYYSVRSLANNHAHRFAFVDGSGPIPDGLFVLHKCDNPPCCNPSHLFLGTHSDNMQDKITKGRTPRGKNHGMAKLTEADIWTIRTMSASGITAAEIADCVGCSDGNVKHILSGKIWGWLK